VVDAKPKYKLLVTEGGYEKVVGNPVHRDNKTLIPKHVIDKVTYYEVYEGNTAEDVKGWISHFPDLTELEYMTLLPKKI
jgi:hypothetical protein